MKRIKELNTLIYEVRDLDKQGMEKAIKDYINICVMLSRGEVNYTLSDEETLDAIEEDESYYDSHGNELPIYNRIKDEDTKSLLYLTDYLVIDITIEDI